MTALILGAAPIFALDSQDPAATPADLPASLKEAERLVGEGQFPGARSQYEKALDLATKAGDESSTAKAMLGIGWAQWGLGDYAGALASQRKALETFRRLGDSAFEARTWNSVGLDDYSMARYDEALEAYREALDANRCAPSPRLEGTILANIGLVFRYLGRLREASDYFDDSLRVRMEAGDAGGAGQTLNHLGMVSRATGQYQRALDDYSASLELRRRAGDRQGEAQTLNNTANVYLDLGEHELAMSLYRQAGDIAREIGYRAQIGYSEQNIGDVLSELGRGREALPHYEAALAIFRQMDRRGAIAQTLRIIGGARLFGLGDIAGARESLTEALEVAKAIREPEAEAEVLNLLGEADLLAGAAEDALVRFDAALAIAVAAGLPGIEYRARGGRGRALRAAGRGEEALTELRASAKIINDLRANIGSDLGKIGFVDIRQDVFGELVDALTEAGRTEEALGVSEASRARAFADLLAQREVLPAPSDRARLERLREASAGLKSPPASGASAAAPAGTEGARERRAREFESSVAGLAEQNEELASLMTVRSATPAEVRAVARRLRATIVEYLATEKRLFAWVVTPAGEIHGAAIGVTRAELAAMTKEVRERIEATPPVAPGARARLRALLRRLDRFLVEPVARWLPSSPEDLVILVPNGPLSLLAFAALEDERGRPLALKHTLALAPAASVFRYTAEKRRERVPGRRPSALLVADPELAPGLGLARLPAARAEVARVKRRLGGGEEVTVLTGASATEAAVRRMAPSREILHFATHGLVSEDRPLASSLSLAAGDGEDGFLRVDEVFGLDLHADLVVLSGCSTGLGRLSGDGVLGLTRAFLYAGTPSVVVSLWDVSDRATSDLMDRFYAGLAAGRNKAHALRSAQLALRALHPDPALWAAFILIGEP